MRRLAVAAVEKKDGIWNVSLDVIDDAGDVMVPRYRTCTNSQLSAASTQADHLINKVDDLNKELEDILGVMDVFTTPVPIYPNDAEYYCCVKKEFYGRRTGTRHFSSKSFDDDGTWKVTKIINPLSSWTEIQ